MRPLSCGGGHARPSDTPSTVSAIISARMSEEVATMDSVELAQQAAETMGRRDFVGGS